VIPIGKPSDQGRRAHTSVECDALSLGCVDGPFDHGSPLDLEATALKIAHDILRRVQDARILRAPSHLST
jgi:hypothetical protein